MNRRRVNAALIVAGAAVVSTDGLANQALAQCELQRLVGAAKYDDNFGKSVSASGNVIVVGATDGLFNLGSGSVFVFRRIVLPPGFPPPGDGGGIVTWLLEAHLLPPDGADSDLFGGSVAVDGDSLVAGAMWDDDLGLESGSAYIFEHDGTTWTAPVKVTASDGSSGDNFGVRVAIDGDRIVATADRDDDAGASSGSAYVFQREGSVWVEQAKLTASDAAAGDRFGTGAAISGDWIVVGAYGDDNLSGAAYVFRNNAGMWTEETKLVASDRAAGDLFGAAVSISGNTIIVGAQKADHVGPISGASYVFTWDGANWGNEVKLTASDAAAGDKFGESVALIGDLALVGAPFNDDMGNESGSAYVFKRIAGLWTEQSKLVPSDGTQWDFFGNAVAISSAFVVVTTLNGILNSGAAYAFAGTTIVPDEDCNGNGVADVCDIAEGFSPDVNANGIPDDCECLADINGDGTVNVLDLINLLLCFGQPAIPGCLGEDINEDGTVNMLDLIELLLQFGQACP